MAYKPFEHLGLKFVSIAIAVWLWMLVAGEPIVQRTVRVPLQYQSIPEGLLLVGDPPMAVDVALRGPSDTIAELSAGDVQAAIRLDSAKAGTRLYHVTPEQVRAPFDIEVEQVIPSTLALRFERSHSKAVPIVPAIDGDPKTGFVVGTITADPPTAIIVGPESDVRRATEATTEPISVVGADATIKEDVTVGMTEGDLRLHGPQRATVTVSIVEAPVEREVSSVPVQLRNEAPGRAARIEPPTIKVKVRGTADRLAELHSERIKAYVDVAGLGPGSYDLPVQVDPLELVGLGAIAPQNVRVQILK